MGPGPGGFGVGVGVAVEVGVGVGVGAAPQVISMPVQSHLNPIPSHDNPSGFGGVVRPQAPVTDP